eukprot:7245929-Prymnesium_polylepis.1
MEPVHIHPRRRSQPGGGQLNGPTQTGGKVTSPPVRGPPTGPRDEQDGCRPWCVQVQKGGPRHRVQPQTCGCGTQQI